MASPGELHSDTDLDRILTSGGGGTVCDQGPPVGVHLAGPYSTIREGTRVPALRGPGRGVSDITEPVRLSEGADCASRPAKASCIRIGCSRTRGRFTAPHNVCGVWPAAHTLGSVRCPMWGYSECGRSQEYKTKQNKTKHGSKAQNKKQLKKRTQAPPSQARMCQLEHTAGR